MSLARGEDALKKGEDDHVPADGLVSGNIVVAGVGGQGVILAGNVVSQVLLGAGFDVKKSEVHGMSQRGGTVVSHVRFGPEVHSVMVEPGSADWVVAFEWEEGLRALPYLKPDGIAIVSTERKLPPAAMLDHRSLKINYPSWTEAPPGVLAIDTLAVAGDAAQAAPVIAQTVLIGALSVLLPFSVQAWHESISAWVPAKALEGNLTAFERGRALAGDVHAVHAAATNGPRPVPVANGSGMLAASPSPNGAAGPANGAAERLVPFVRIERSWCKGCNICVAVCPESCLILDRLGVAVFARPELCTGCQLCAWLCPDLAMDVLRIPAVAAAAPAPLHEEEHVETTADPR